MFKRKPIYIILLVIFTLLLCADITAYCLAANLSAGVSAVSGNAFDPSRMQGEMPDVAGGDFDPSRMQGEMPDVAGGDFDPTQMQGGLNRQDITVQTGFNAFLVAISDFINGWWIPLGVVFALVDALCIWMLLRIRRKNKAGPQDGGGTGGDDSEEQIAEEPQISHYEKRRRKKKRTLLIVFSALALLVTAVVGYVVVRGIYEAQIAQAQSVAAVSAQAGESEIDTTISATGTLADEDADALSLITGVAIEEYYVEDGDTVAVGDALARVDQTSVMATIAELQSALNDLDEQIDEASEDRIETNISASVDGRVKLIYAQEGEQVSDIMYENGALMLISIDGLMAADVETDADLSAGDSVTVVFGDGTEQTGRVSSVFSGGIIITVTDNGYALGETVSVKDENGSVLGSAGLYIHSELKVTGFSGTVSSIRCEENEEVSSGDTLLKLTNTEYTAQYELLIEKRQEYEDAMMRLFLLYQDGNIYSEAAGTVSGVNENLVSDSSLLQVSAAQSGSDLSVEPGITLSAQAGGMYVNPLLGNNPAGTDDVTVEGYFNYAASVSAVSYSEISLLEYATSISITDYSDYASLGITAQMMTVPGSISPAFSTPVYMFEAGAWKTCALSDIFSGDTLILTYASEDRTADPVWIIIAEKSEGDSGGSGFTGGSHSASPSTAADDTEETTEPEYTLAEQTLMSITPNSAMRISVTIDELDILSVKTGQRAQVTLDALESESFAGAVTDIAKEGTNSGGSTKYTITVELDKTDDMLAGMNAAVSITLLETDCAVTIPVAALVENESGVFVYTSYDEETQTFGGVSPVSTGLSDGTSVEILSGVGAGDTIWYEYNDIINITNSVVDSSGGGFNLMQLFRGGR